MPLQNGQGSDIDRTKSQRKWKSMSDRGLQTFAVDHSKTFRRRVKRGIPQKYRWRSWLLLTGVQDFLNLPLCGSKVPELFSTPVIHPVEEPADNQSTPGTNRSSGFPDHVSLIKLDTDCTRIECARSLGACLRYHTDIYNKQLLACSESLSPREFYNRLAAIKSPYHVLIEIDSSRTFPEIGKFDKQVQSRLLRILNAYANFAPHVGYCQGMNFVCGFSFLVASDLRDGPSTLGGDGFNLQSDWDITFEEHEVFYFLCCLMSKYNLHGFYRESFPLLEPFVAGFQRMCRQFTPMLMTHFEAENMLSPVYVHQWYLTLFVTSLPPGAVVVIWDYLLCTNMHSLIAVTMALLKVLQNFLLRLRFEGIVRFLKSLKNSGNCDENRIGRMLVKQAEEFREQFQMMNLLNEEEEAEDDQRDVPEAPGCHPGGGPSIDFLSGHIRWEKLLKTAQPLTPRTLLRLHQDWDAAEDADHQGPSGGNNSDAEEGGKIAASACHTPDPFRQLLQREDDSN